MTRVAFGQQLSELQRDLLVLADVVARAIDSAVGAMEHRDYDLARIVVEHDQHVNARRFSIEEKCLDTIATQQPIAGDLRILASVLHIVVDLERMGDHAVGLARIAGGLKAVETDDSLPEIRSIADMAIAMLRDAVDAFRARDADLAREVAARDDTIDSARDRVVEHVFATMRLSDELRPNPEVSTGVLEAVHHLERIADRVTNICERVIYLVDGHVEELNPSQ